MRAKHETGKAGRSEGESVFTLAMFGPKFDAERVEAEKVEAMLRAEAGATESLKELLRTAVREVARTRATFKTDDVWRLLDLRPTLQTGRPLGPIMLQARDAGVCRAIGYSRSARVGSHGKATALWKSLIFEGQQKEAQAIAKAA